MSRPQNLLVCILDVNSFAWENRSNQSIHFRNVLESLIIFINAHFLLHRQNEVCLIAMAPDYSTILSLGGRDAQSSKTNRSFNEIILDKIDEQYHKHREILLTHKKNYCALAKALSQAMCGSIYNTY
jgi:hypothetical protein